MTACPELVEQIEAACPELVEGEERSFYHGGLKGFDSITP
jgi:hypothetical protein